MLFEKVNLMEHRKIFTTADGSHSIYSREGIAYHSIHGAIQESKHVYIDAGLKPIVKHNPHQTIAIFELGFGTGLNALLTASFAKENDVNIQYKTIEPFPLQEAEFEKLNYGKILNQEDLFFALHQCRFNGTHQLLPNFSFIKNNSKVEKFSTNQLFHLIYFDAFAPTTQPQLWDETILQKMYNLLYLNGILVTYCSKGIVKRALTKVGFKVEALTGPPKKREMIRAIKP